jgi:multidrug resistance efflux pump
MLQRGSNEFPTTDIVELLGGETAPSLAPPELPVGPAAPRRPTTPRRRAVFLLVAAGLIFGLWWGLGYVAAYTDDAYVDSDVVQVTPEVSGPIEAVRVRDNQWIKRGSILFTIDPRPFKLELQRAIAKEERARAQLPVDKATIESLRAQKEAADEAARLAAIDLGRVTPLTADGFASKQTYDNTLTAQQQSVASNTMPKQLWRKRNRRCSFTKLP